MIRKVPIPRNLLRRLIFLAILSVIITVILVMAAVSYGWSNFARALPELQPWHKERPESEFTADDETADFTLDDYLRVEDEVFRELAGLETGPWATAATGGLNRFRPGSLSHPDTVYGKNWNRSFVREVTDPVGGALLIHGLSDSPYSFRSLADTLHSRGYTVVGLRVPGHGTCPAALAKVEWDDWAAAVRVAARSLRQRLPENTPMLVMGFSNGGALSVDYAVSAIHDESLPCPDALVLLSPMIGISPMAKVTRYHHWIAAVSGEERAHWSGIGAPVDPFKYSSWPMNASVQAWKMTRRVDERLADLEQSGLMKDFPPVLTCQSAIDATVKVSQLMSSLFGRLEPNGSELLVFDINRAGWMENLLKLDFEKALLPAFEREDLPYELILVTNAEGDSHQVEARSREGNKVREEDIEEPWPREVFSLSHSALPFPMDDPIYGANQPDHAARLPLGTLNFRGESGVLLISDGQILRLRHNPFYNFMEDHILQWLGEHAPPNVD